MADIFNYLDKIVGAFSSFDFPYDLLDILFVTVIVYQLIKLIRGSRTFELVKGIVLFVIAYVFVKLLNMEASEYMFSVLFENALIILVVLFAPELRKILEKFGRQSISNISFFSFNSNADYIKIISETINCFCKATLDMSETKTGALVVFEKNSPIKEIVETGTIVDAQASTELFNGLFFKNSALHDGAVVVRDGRIYSAGCILPLTQNTGLDSELGTRHRAAIGMSEQSDAVVVVVSEETGSISIAKNGVLTRDISNGKLREILLDEFVVKTDEADKGNKKLLSRLFKKNGGDKNEKQ